MTVSLDTHAYDAKWHERLKYVNSLDDAFFYEAVYIEGTFDDYINRTSWPDNVRNQAINWHSQMTNNSGSNNDSANQVCASDLIFRLERIIQYRLTLEDSISEMNIDEIDSLCVMYSILKTGDCLDFDQPDDNDHPIVVDHSNLLELVRFANDSIIDSYIEQLADVQNGACAQGRTTRLFQLYATFY